MKRERILCAAFVLLVSVRVWVVLAPTRVSTVPPPRCALPLAVQLPFRPLRVLCFDRNSVTEDELLQRVGSPCRGSATRMVHGHQVTVSTSCRIAVGKMSSVLRLTMGLRIEVNSATATELEALPRIGPALARRIVRSRERLGPYPSVRALTRVRGIGDKTVRQLEGLITTTRLRSAR